MPLPKDLIFDPSGDVILLLKRNHPERGLIGLGHHESAEGELANEVIAVKGYASEDSSAESPNDELPNTAPDIHIDEDDDVEVQVSSRHLALASRVFRAMFDGKFRESLKPGRSQLIPLPLPDDNLDAMLLLLAIIHGLTRRVPRKVNEKMYLEVVILVDKYDFHQVAEVFMDMWFGALGVPSPDVSSPDLASWIYICWVLGKRDTCQDLTKIAQYERTCRFEDGDVLFPTSIAGKSVSQCTSSPKISPNRQN